MNTSCSLFSVCRCMSDHPMLICECISVNICNEMKSSVLYALQLSSINAVLYSQEAQLYK